MKQAAKRDYEEEDLRPLVVEFAGSPRAGKSSTIEIIEHFFRRSGFRVFAPAEGASKRTPQSLKGDLVVFNAWSLNYAISELLTAFYSRDRPNLVLLDRGPFDALAWFRQLESQDQLSSVDKTVIESYALHERWIRLIDLACVLTCSPDKSLERERSKKLTNLPGVAMNEDFLKALLDSYGSVQSDLGKKYDIVHFDTSEDLSPRAIAYQVASRILDLADRRLTDDEVAQEVKETVATLARQDIRSWMSVSMFWLDSTARTELLKRIGEHARLVERKAAERRSDIIQLISHALVRSGEKLLCLSRSAKDKRPELRGKLSLLFGGHVDGTDFAAESGMLEGCLRRELREELQLQTLESVEHLGFVTDTTSAVGRTHLGCVFEVAVTASEISVSAAADLVDYFPTKQKRVLQLQTINWVSERKESLDPWSRLVFDAYLQPSSGKGR